MPRLTIYDRLHQSPTARRLVSGGIWAISGSALSRVGSLAASIIIARILGRVSFGEYGVLLTTVGMLSVLGNLGMGMTATKYVAENWRHDPTLAGEIIGLSTLLSTVFATGAGVILIAFAPFIATHWLAAPQLVTPLRIAALSMTLIGLNAAQVGALTGFEEFRSIARINLIGALLSIPPQIVLVIVGGVWGAAWGLVISQAVLCLLAHRALARTTRVRHIRVHVPPINRHAHRVLAFSVPAMLSGLMVAPVTWASNAFLANTPNGYAELGVFSAANQWRTAVLFIPMNLSAVALPVLSELLGSKNFRQYRRVLLANIVVVGTTTAALAALVMVAAPWIMHAYGPEFASGVPVLWALAVTAVLSATIGVIGQAIASSGAMWAGFWLNLLWAVVLLFLCVKLADRGALGLAFANIGAYMFHLVTVGAYTALFSRRLIEGKTDVVQGPAGGSSL